MLEFEVANNSSKDITISSLANFEAYCDGYSINSTMYESFIDKDSLDGTVAAGKKLKGFITYEVDVNYKEFEINVSTDFWNSKDIKFIINK